MVALGAISCEVRESFLERQPEDLHVDVIGQTLSKDEEEVAKDEGGEKIDDVGTSGAERHSGLIDQNEEGESGEDVELHGP